MPKVKAGSTNSLIRCSGNWFRAQPFTKPREEVICRDRIIPMQNSAQGAEVEPSMPVMARMDLGIGMPKRLTAAPSAE